MERGKSTGDGTASLQAANLPEIAIIGMGFAGTTTAIRLMQLASVKIRLLLIEQQRPQAFGGLAYGSDGLLRDHYLNIHAGRISMFRERPDDFLKWADEDTDLKQMYDALGITDPERIDAQLAAEWKDRLTFYESSPVPRLIYKLYLEKRFEDACARSKGTVEIQWITSHVSNLEEYDDHTRLHFDFDPAPWHRDVEIAVLCTGHAAPLLPEGLADSVREHPAFFPQPFVSRFNKRLSNYTMKDNLLIIGSGLSAFDAVTSALSLGYHGRITTCSRHGLTHEAYPDTHSHHIIPSVFEDLFCGVRTADRMRQAIENAIARAQSPDLAKYFDEDPRVIPERVLKAIEPQVKVFVATATTTEVRLFVKTNRSWITTMRTSVVPLVAQRIRTAEVTDVSPQELLSISRGTRDQLNVKFKREPDGKVTDRRFTMIVCCMGYDPDYAQATGLWKQLVESHVAAPHEKTGLGIQVGNNGRMVVNHRGDKTLSRSLYAVGTMRQGDEIEQRGRLGAFTFSIGTIRNQCLMAVLSILKHVECPAYRSVTVERQQEIKAEIETMLGPKGTLRQNYSTLVPRVANACFGPISPGRDQWVTITKANVESLCNIDFQGSPERDLYLHELWHGVRIRAGHLVTDIRRLSDRYENVREYHPDTQTRCLAKANECKTELKRLIEIFTANSGSLSMFSAQDKSLRPFVTHLRLSKISPTLYGTYHAGLLVKAFCEGVSEDMLRLNSDMFPSLEIVPFYFKRKLVGIMIPDYNRSLLKKPAFDDDSPRIYPNVIVSLVLDNEFREILGAVYLEAFPGRFVPNDVQKVFKESQTLAPLLASFKGAWNADSERNYEGVTFESVDRGMELSGKSLKNVQMLGLDVCSAKMNGCVLYGTDISGSTFDGVEMRRAYFIGTSGVGTTFCRSDLGSCEVYGANFRGAVFNDCTFESGVIVRSDFTGAKMGGVNLTGVEMRHVDLSNVYLRGAVLIGMSFVSCEWRNTDLMDCVVNELVVDQLPSDIREKYECSFKWNHSIDDEPVTPVGNEGIPHTSDDADDEGSGKSAVVSVAIDEQEGTVDLSWDDRDCSLAWKGNTASFRSEHGNLSVAGQVVRYLYGRWRDPETSGKEIEFRKLPPWKDRAPSSKGVTNGGMSEEGIRRQVRIGAKIMEKAFGSKGPILRVIDQRAVFLVVPSLSEEHSLRRHTE